MDTTERLRRRYTISLVASLTVLAGIVSLFFWMGSGLARWLVLLTWTFIVLTRWELLRSLPRSGAGTS